MLGMHGSIVIPQNSKYAEEMRRHEGQFTQFGQPGRPYVYYEYPKRLYKCSHVLGRGIDIVDRYDVENADQERNMNSRGFYELKKAAEMAEREQTEYGKLAAEREWQIQHGRVSAKATAEVRAAEEAHGARHLPDVPETPIKRRGRPVKKATAQTEEV